jgi:hypothetical protein
MNYWINSNTGDYINECDGVYRLYLRSRWVDNQYLNSEIIEISKIQFDVIKGFIPIKEKKLFSRLNSFREGGRRYAPTLPDGTKGTSQRIEVPTLAEARQEILKKLGL